MADTGVPGRLLSGLNDLLRLPLDASERDVFLRAIDLAEAVTGSRIGYVHYVNPDQETVELGVWSTATVAHCAVVNDRHYPISDAGVWADTFRTRQPLVHNDYASLPNRRGLPLGHSPVLRHLGVPVIEDGAVRLLLGVGNKPEPYTEDDVSVAQQVADDTWLVTRRLRAFRQATQDLSLLRDHQASARLGTWEYDPETGLVTVGPVSQSLVWAASDGVGRTRTWAELLDRVEPEYRDRLREVTAQAQPDTPFAEEVRVRTPSGDMRKLRMTGTWVPDHSGFGHLLRGTLADLSAEDEVARAEYEAAHDSLTGLLNRNGLLQDLATRLDRPHRRAEDEFALLFVDLDGFKAVNDHYGHVVGDDVLRGAGHRLAGAVRVHDVVARYGGDEFVVVQTGGPDETAIRGLAGHLLAALAVPLQSGGHEFRIGASIGAATSVDSLPGVEALISRADMAQYEAKRMRCGLVIASAPRPL